MPVKPSSSRRRSSRISRLTVAGVSPTERTTIAAVMIDRTPASIATQNGSSALVERIDDRQCKMRVHGGVAVAGKCFAHAATPALCRPRTNAATCRATSSPSAPNARIPITGFSGVRVDVGDGREVEIHPASASSAPIETATRSVSSTSSTTPSAALPGYDSRRGLEPGDVAALLVDCDERSVRSARRSS